MQRWKKLLFILLELLLRIILIPQLRAHLLRLGGAKVGKNVRIYEIRLLNLDNGFKNLDIADDVHIGMGCYFDLQGKIIIGKGVSISPRVTILTHADPGSHHHAPLCQHFPAFIANVRIDDYCWLGVNSTILAGSHIQQQTVIGAASLVKGVLLAHSLYYGVPARKIKSLNT
jgi:acetyltransferase-like isoleucine patch superfamily enzyme